MALDFDRTTRSLSQRLTRRTVTAVLFGLAAPSAHDAAAAPRTVCRKTRASCNRHAQCCSGECYLGPQVPRAIRNRCGCGTGACLEGASCVPTGTIDHCAACNDACPAGDVCYRGSCCTPCCNGLCDGASDGCGGSCSAAPCDSDQTCIEGVCTNASREDITTEVFYHKNRVMEGGYFASSPTLPVEYSMLGGTWPCQSSQHCRETHAPYIANSVKPGHYVCLTEIWNPYGIEEIAVSYQAPVCAKLMTRCPD